MSTQELFDLLDIGSSNSNSQPKPSPHFNHQRPQGNQFQHNNYPGLISNPNHHTSSPAQFPLQQIHNTAQNVGRKFLDLFQKDDEIKKTSNTQAGKTQKASNLRNAPQNLWNNSISSIDVVLSSLSISDDSKNHTKDRSGLPQEENKNYHQENELATRLKKAIENNYVDPVILVNETFSKMKGCSPQFEVKQSLSNANVLSFRCYLEYDSQTSGHGKGSSQKAARIEAAKQVLNVLLTNKQYSTERKYIDLYLDKKQPNMHNKKDKRLHSSEAYDFDDQENDEKGSALYNLNEIAKTSSTQIFWQESQPMTANGGYKFQVLFDGLIACGEGKRKVDAKQKAAKKILEQIKINQKLINKYDCTKSLLV